MTQNTPVIADSGFFIALGSQRDAHHLRAKQFAEKSKRTLLTTWPVLTETCYLLDRDAGPRAVSTFLGRSHFFDIAPQTLMDLTRIHELIQRYADLPMDLADASLVLLAETLGSGDILSTDERDFGVYRFKNHKPFRNLLLR